VTYKIAAIKAICVSTVIAGFLFHMHRIGDKLERIARALEKRP